MNNEIDKYKDIINLPHHISKKYPQMLLHDRAAQFGAFAALTGFEDDIKETERIISKRIEIDEEKKTAINSKLQQIKKDIQNKPMATFTYFIADLKKDGGEYVTITDRVIKIDGYKKILILECKTEIPIFEIINIEYDEIKK